MKKIFTLIVLFLSLQSLTKADDIREFEIEGMSIGDSLLDFYDDSLLMSIDRFYYPNSKKYFGLTHNSFDENLETYESIQFIVKPEKYEIISVAGRNYKFQNDRDACYKEMEKIFNDIKSLFPNSEFRKGKEKAHAADKSGKSVAKVYSIFLNNGRISVTCTDWSKKITEESNREDSLKVAIHKKEYMDWINSEAY